MKITKIFILFLLVSFSTNNANILITKKSAENIRFWSMILAVLDIFSKDYVNLPEKRIYTYADFKIKFFDRLVLELDIPKKFDFLQFDNPKDSYLTINPITLTSNVFAASQEKTIFDESILIPILELYLRIKNLDQNNDMQKNLFKIEPEIILAEKMLEHLVVKTLNTTIKKQKILKRFSRVILLASISTMGAYLRTVLAKHLLSEQLENKLPQPSTVFIDSLAERLIIEFFAELVQRYIIEDPEKQKLEEKKKRFQQKLEDIIASTNGNKNSMHKIDKEKKSFELAPV
jgi:hypothetical protein